jgi:hypothetical protein
VPQFVMQQHKLCLSADRQQKNCVLLALIYVKPVLMNAASMKTAIVKNVQMLAEGVLMNAGKWQLNKKWSN